MPVVLVHGNPETSAVWDVLVSRLAEQGVSDVVRLSPPGFGAPIPDGFGATAAEYVDWLAAEVEALGSGPTHVVGHDWGAGHVMGLLATRPELVTTWATDCVGLIAPDYVWHDAAQGWQTPGVGEEMVDAFAAMSVGERAAALLEIGLIEPINQHVSEAIDADMGRCILALYRSAAQPYMAELGERVVSSLSADGAPSGLGIVAMADPYVSAEQCDAAAQRLGARVAQLPGAGHWWMLSDHVDQAAAVLVAHWRS